LIINFGIFFLGIGRGNQLFGKREGGGKKNKGGPVD